MKERVQQRNAQKLKLKIKTKNSFSLNSHVHPLFIEDLTQQISHIQSLSAAQMKGDNI